MSQGKLWHETFEDALRSCVDAAGGFKKVGAAMWPALPIDQAGRRLAMSLDLDRPEKLSLSELVLLLKVGRQAGCHFPMSYLAKECGYTEPAPINPQSEDAALKMEFNRRVDELRQLVSRIEKIDSRGRR